MKTILICIILIIINIFLLVKNISQIKQLNISKQRLLAKIDKESKEKELALLEKDIEKKIKDIKQYQDIKNQYEKNLNNELALYKEKISNEQLMYLQSLEKAAQQKELQFQQKKSSLKKELQSLIEQLNKIKQTRAAAQEAFLREKEIKDNKENYCLIPSQDELDDTYKLERIKKELHKPRILSMLIWQSVWQPLAKKQFPIILKSSSQKTGIYKITNLITGQCYIGQATDINQRWKQHCKYGLGIDTPSGNKLYKAMKEYGLENFAFELIEECSKEQLNEKEKYFIELYDTKNFGYNSTGGNK